MKTAICYYSRHHGNTLKVIKAMGTEEDVDLIDVTARTVVQLEQYDLIGFASGIYYGKFSPAVTGFAWQYLPEQKKVFFVYTYGAPKVSLPKGMVDLADEKHATIVGEYGCRGFDTFGPLKIVGGIAREHPTAEELAKAKEFLNELRNISD